MQTLGRAAAVALLAVLVIFAVHVHRLERVQRNLNADRVVLSHISYGLFSVDTWKVIAADVIAKKVDEFEVTPANRKDLLRKTEEILDVLIDEIEKLMRERNSKSLGGVFKQFFADMLISFDDIRADIPNYAEAIVDRLDTPETKAALKQWLVERIETFANETVGSMDYTALNTVLLRYGCNDRSACLTLISAYRQDARLQSRTAVFIFAVLVIAALAWMLRGTRDRITYSALTLVALVLLVAGVSLPMIDIEATISEFSFILMGEPIVFRDQVLFFQSKSIAEVVQLLLINGDWPLILVSFLVFSFSILLPALKLALTLVAVSRNRLPRSKVLQAVLFRSAKWSMADVLVVALFMAFIGFSGIINNQLTQIERGSATLEVFTTNQSTLRLGFYMFTAYALAGLLLSERLKQVIRTEPYSNQPSAIK
jgi:hypothetical protein